mmetsp:Transcript_16914/g.30680  ORF Transcript_16914/g.30680 Transcript_16914/m.30680 type:complete len:87 (-) Transcript_16914:2347-2607(-)
MLLDVFERRLESAEIVVLATDFLAAPRSPSWRIVGLACFSMEAPRDPSREKGRVTELKEEALGEDESNDRLESPNESNDSDIVDGG